MRTRSERWKQQPIDTMQTEFGRRIDAAQQFRLQGLALVVALTATSAIVGTFALQLLAAF